MSESSNRVVLGACAEDSLEEESKNCIIDQILVGHFAVFSYLVTDPATGEAALIDPGADPSRILEKIRTRRAITRWIVCTHTHPDHIGATAVLKRETCARVAIHETDNLVNAWTRKLLVRQLDGGKKRENCRR